MSSFLDELKNRLKTGNANAELKIITGGGKAMPAPVSQGGSKITTMQIVGCVIGGAIIVLLVVSLILFCNNQREKTENLNLIDKQVNGSLEAAEKDLSEVVKPPPATSLAEDEMAENLQQASERMEKKKPPANADPNFTLLKDLL